MREPLKLRRSRLDRESVSPRLLEDGNVHSRTEGDRDAPYTNCNVLSKLHKFLYTPFFSFLFL